MWAWWRVAAGPIVRSADDALTLRERDLLDAAEALVSSWEAYDDDASLRHEDALVCALERLDGALDPYHLPSDGGE